MKKLLLVFLVAFAVNANAQITFENKYIGGVSGFKFLRPVHLTSSGYKYQIIDRYNSKIMLYNLNHSLWKTINVPSQGSTKWDIYYLSEELFNVNAADIEYILGNWVQNYVKIYDESGVLLFSKDSVQVGVFSSASISPPIFYTSAGAKMILPNSFTNVDSSSYVYGLPGTLPCNECTDGTVSGLAPGGGGYRNEIGISNSYPNPAINSTRIDYTFPSEVNQGEIVFYDLQGKEIKRYKVDKTFDHLLISTADIQAGTYFYQLQTSGAASAGKKMVVIK